MSPRRKSPAKLVAKAPFVLLVTCDRYEPVVITDPKMSTQDARLAFCRIRKIEHPDKAGATIRVRLTARKDAEAYLDGEGEDNP